MDGDCERECGGDKGVGVRERSELECDGEYDVADVEWLALSIMEGS